MHWISYGARNKIVLFVPRKVEVDVNERDGVDFVSKTLARNSVTPI